MSHLCHSSVNHCESCFVGVHLPNLFWWHWWQVLDNAKRSWLFQRWGNANNNQFYMCQAPLPKCAWCWSKWCWQDSQDSGGRCLAYAWLQAKVRGVAPTAGRTGGKPHADLLFGFSESWIYAFWQYIWAYPHWGCCSANVCIWKHDCSAILYILKDNIDGGFLTEGSRES